MDQVRIGVLSASGTHIHDLNGFDAALPYAMEYFIALGERGRKVAQEAIAADGPMLALTDVALLAPIPSPRRNLFCIGKNYRDHLDEVKSLPDGGDGEPEFPIVFTKATTTVIGPGAAIPASSDPTDSTDYEGELAIVIGPGGRNIPRARAMTHVYGYTIVNDVTSRVVQSRHHQWFLGKSLDGFCPMGPFLLTADAVADVGELRVETFVNGERRQCGMVHDMIFDIPRLIEEISALVTLVPGDVIATGTPAGVGAGRHPPVYLRPGDRVEVRVDPIGVLANPVQ